MRYILRVIQVIYSIYAMVVFGLLMFILFLPVVFASLFGQIRGGNMIYRICTFWADAAMLLWGMPHKNIFDMPHNPDHPVIFVFNHISYLDIPILLKSFRYQHIRVLGKAEMAKLPVFGFIYKSAAILVERDNASHRARSVIKLKAVLKKNISVVIAPEGTFNMTDRPLKEFYDGAFRIAIETQTPIKPVIFLDAYDRLNYESIFSFTPGRSRTVYLEQVEVNNYSLDEVNKLKEKVYQVMEAGLIKHKASWIKTT